MILIFVVISNKLKALSLAQLLLERKIIACYSISTVRSSYWWKNKIAKESAFQLILKSNKSNFSLIEKLVIEHSGEETPEIFAIKPDKVSAQYLCWLQSVLQ